MNIRNGISIFTAIVILGCISAVKIPATSGEKSIRKPTVSKPNILWLVTEDISPYIACYGDSTASTPNLDRLAREGVRFTNVYHIAGVCAPSRSALITGMY